MKRSVASIVLAGFAGVVCAQAPFTIVRPQDGAKVREKVRVLIPKGSVPETGYVGIFLDGKFVEARGIDSLIPEDRSQREKYLEYVLDTKGRGIPDSEPGKPIKLEIVKYVDNGNRTSITQRSSVELYVANSASIPVPSNGFLLRYGFAPGTELTYNVEVKTSLASITQGGNRAGGRANEQDVSIEKFRVLYAVDNRYDNGDGLLRIQPLPDKGKDYTITTIESQSAPRKFMVNELDPVYQRLTGFGKEIWGSVPMYFGIEGNSGGSGGTNLIVGLPLPSLPVRAQRPGDTWRGEFQLPGLDASKLHEVNTIVQKQTARGEFVGVEWEQGHPCAVLRNSIRVGDNTTEGAALKKSGAKMTDEKLDVEENTWFALDRKVVLKRTLNISMDVSGDKVGLFGGSTSSGGASGGNGAGGAGSAGGPGLAPPGQGGGGGLSSPDGLLDIRVKGGQTPMNQRNGGGQRGGGRGGAQSGPPGGMQGPGAAPGGGPRGPGGAPFGGQSGPGGRPQMGPGGFGGPTPGGGQGFGQGRQGGDPSSQQLAFVRVKYSITMQLEK